jgi:hypothetical protein
MRPEIFETAAMARAALTGVVMVGATVLSCTTTTRRSTPPPEKRFWSPPEKRV